LITANCAIAVGTAQQTVSKFGFGRSIEPQGLDVEFYASTAACSYDQPIPQ